jgi:broad specificity phosphatase PhoE
MRLLLVRHGVAEGQDGRVVGHSDPPLSEQGRKDIAALLTSGLDRPALLLSSDLRRASESAEILAAHWGIEVVTDARLRELHFGQWENRTWTQLEREDGARLGRWMSDWTTTRTPGGESFADLAARTTEWLAEWQNSRVTGGTTLVVAHAGSIRAILCRLLRVPLEQAFEFEVPHARVTCLDIHSKTTTITKARKNRKHEVSVHHHPFNGQSRSVEVEQQAYIKMRAPEI